MLIQIDDKTVINFDEIASIKECVENEFFAHTVFTLKNGIQVYSDTPLKGVVDIMSNAYCKGIGIDFKRIVN